MSCRIIIFVMRVCDATRATVNVSVFTTVIRHLTVPGQIHKGLCLANLPRTNTSAAVVKELSAAALLQIILVSFRGP